jgi:hypothetical protein
MDFQPIMVYLYFSIESWVSNLEVPLPHITPGTGIVFEKCALEAIGKYLFPVRIP